METVEALDGWWWLPGADDQAQFGRLTAGRAGPWRLDLFGALTSGDAGFEDLLAVTSEMPSTAVIHGYLVPGSPGSRSVTLLDCWQTNANRQWGGRGAGLRTESWTFQEMVTGDEHVQTDEVAVEFRVRLSSLLEWSCCQPPRVQRSEGTLTATVSTSDLGRATVPGATVDLIIDHAARETGSEASVVQRAMFQVIPDPPLPVQTSMTRFGVRLRSLLSFLVLGHVDVESCGARLEPDPEVSHPRWVDYRARLQRPIDVPKEPGRHEMLAAWPTLEDLGVQGLVGRWFELYEEVEKTITLLLVPHHAPYLYTDDHLMTAFVAMEAYHAARIGGTAVDPDEHDRRVTAVVDGSPVEHRAWVKEALAGRNQKGQRRKLNDLIERAGPTGQSILTAAPGFADLAIKCRQRVAHPGPSGEEPGAKYLAVSYGLRWMLRHCLLVDLGLNESKAAETIGACRVFENELTLVKRWAADE